MTLKSLILTDHLGNQILTVAHPVIMMIQITIPMHPVITMICQGNRNYLKHYQNGKAWLINCNAGSLTEWGINSDNSFRDENKIYIDNFKGMNVHPDINYKLIDKY